MDCQNPVCEFADRCVLRAVENLDVDPTPSVGPQQVPPAFTIDEHGIGTLRILGAIGEATTDAGIAMIRDLHRIKGLLVVFDSHGGSALHGDILAQILKYAGGAVVVIGVVKKAFSAALSLSAACQRIFADSEDSQFGCFGAIAQFCNGRQPQLLCSSQSPHKIPKGRLLFGPAEFVPYTAQEVKLQQRLLNERYSADLKKISKLRRVPPEVLAEVLDGRRFTAREAKYFDLVDGIAPEEQAYQQLLNERK